MTLRRTFFLIGSVIAACLLTAVAAAQSPTGSVVARIDIGTEAWIVTAAGRDNVWAEGPNGVLRIDTATNEIRVRTRIKGAPSGGTDALWVASGRKLRGLDPETGAVKTTVTLPSAGESVLALPGVLWVTSPDAQKILRVDLRAKKVVATIRACDIKFSGLAVAGGALWALCYNEGQLLRIDTKANKVVKRIPVGYGVHSLVAGAGSLWINNHSSGWLVRFDVRQGRVVARLRTGTNVGIAFVHGRVWAAGAASVLVIDPVKNAITGRLPIGNGEYYAIASAAGSLWVSTVSQEQVLRLDPKSVRPASR